MTISCIIACYNGEKYLEDTVKSIVDQDYHNWTLEFINDGSTDNSQKLMVDLKLKYGISDRVFIHSFSKNMGITHAKQSGFEFAHGEYVMSLDCDDIIAPNYMSEMLKTLENNPDRDYVYCDTTYFYPDGTEKRFEQPEFNIIKLIENNFISYCILMRKKAFLNTGYNLNNNGKHEDYELYLRLMRKGHYGKHLALPLFYYRVHADQSIQAEDVKNKEHLFKAYFVTQYPEIFPENWLPMAKKQLEMIPDNFMSLKGIELQEALKKYNG